MNETREAIRQAMRRHAAGKLVTQPAPATASIRTRPVKKYCFFTTSHDWRPRLLISGPGLRTRRYELTGDTYARFVALANSGAYLIGIDTDESVAWTLRRKPE